MTQKRKATTSNNETATTITIAPGSADPRRRRLSMSVLSGLDLHPCLRARVNRTHPPPTPTPTPSNARNDDVNGNDDSNDDDAAPGKEGFVLYLPTVCLHPAGAVARLFPLVRDTVPPLA